MPQKRTGTVTDEGIRAAAHVACCSLVYRAVEQLSLPLQNLGLELQGEKGPFKKGARSHAKTATGIIESVKKLYDAKVEFRRVLGTSPEADELLKVLPDLLTALNATIFRPLRRAATRGSEKSARQAIIRVRIAAKKLNDLASDHSDKARNLLSCAIGQLSRAVPISSDTKNASKPPKAVAIQTLPMQQSKHTCVSIDMSEYGRLSEMLEEVAEVRTLFQFNQDLQGFFREKVKAAGGNPDTIPSISTGDGALMFFPDASQAVRFALAVQKDASHSNRGKDSSNQKRYRIGLCTGEICLQETRAANGTLVSFAVAGIPIARAVRLQAKCELDRLLLCEKTYVAMNKKLHDHCDPNIEKIEGKPHEKWRIDARHCTP